MKNLQHIEKAREAGKRIHHFHGGLRLRHHKKVSCRVAVERPVLPKELVVPLLQHAGDATNPIVAVGDSVLKGQVLAICDPGAAVHAPASGIVVAIENRQMSHPSGMPGPCVVIQPDGREQWTELHPVDDWMNASAEQLIDQIRHCGLVGLGGAVFPTHAKTIDGRQRQIHTLVLNGAECEPYISCDEMLMREQPDKIILGARILRRAMGAERVLVAIEDQMGAVHHALSKAAECAECKNITIIKVPMIYPEGGERQLIEVLTGLQVPVGGRPSDLGMICQNVATAAAVAEAVTEGKPLIERYVTVTGSGISQPRNLLVLFGTPFSHLVEACGGYNPNVSRLVVGGPMMGFPVAADDTPVVKSSNCILALSADDVRAPQAEMPCIRCGECARVCPASLLPQQLNLQVRNGLWDLSREYGLSACIECGCCDLVCPSHIPLVDWFRYGKGEIRQREREAAASELARKRFENREARLLRRKQERAEKMTKRKQALKDKTDQQARIKASITRAKSKAAKTAASDHSDTVGGKSP